MVLTVGCDNVHEVCSEMLKKCRDLMSSVTFRCIREREELEKLHAVVKEQSKFNAAGFFHINRSVLLSVFAAITTYMIVIVQFDSL